MTRTGWMVVVTVVVAALAVFTFGPQLRGADEPGGAVHAGPAPASGEEVIVYLRGDATGAVFGDRIPNTANLTQLRGTILNTDANWLNLKEGSRHHHIPIAAIALVTPVEKTAGAKPK